MALRDNITPQQLTVLNEIRTVLDTNAKQHRELDTGDGLSQIRWMRTDDVGGRTYRGNRERKIVDPVTGEERIERQPSLGHKLSSDYIEREHGGAWCEQILNSSGSFVHMPMTNGSARRMSTGRFVLDAYHRAMLEKCTAFGWFPVSRCPVDLIASGELRAKTLLDSTIATSAPCAPGTYSEENPCRHVMSERALRTAKHSAEQARIAEASRSKEDLGQVAMAQTIATAVRESLAQAPKRGK